MNSYVAGGWAATAAILGGYAWRILRRGRLLREALPERSRQPSEERR